MVKLLYFYNYPALYTKEEIMSSNVDTVTSQDASNEALNELEQLRLLVFGQAKQALDSRIDKLSQLLAQETQTLQSNFDERFSALERSLNKQHESMLTQINELANVQESDKAELMQSQNNMLSQLEMAENASKDDSTLIHKRIDDEVTKLEADVDKATLEILEKLEQVTKELSGSKTDRKKLALLLSTMASNLDADD